MKEELVNIFYRKALGVRNTEKITAKSGRIKILQYYPGNIILQLVSVEKRSKQFQNWI